MTKPLTSIASALVLALLSTPAVAACGSTTAASRPEEVVQAQVDAYNAHDARAFADCYADDARLAGLSGKSPPVEGKTAIRQAYASLFARKPKTFAVEILERTVSGAIVVDLERTHGLPAEKRLPDSFAVYEVRDGRIANVWFPPASR
jgi:putative hydrolase of HD superfamily